MPKLINRLYGYDEFECVIRGKIVMTREQFDTAIKHLMRTRKWLDNSDNSRWYKSAILARDLSRFVIEKKSRIYNVRLPATREIARMFNLKNYKQVNYVIEVI